MQKILLTSLLLILASACTTVEFRPIDRASTATLSGQSINTTRREAPGFAAGTAGKAVFGMFGAIAMIAEGNKLVKDNDVPDPANTIAAELAKFLEEKYSAKIQQPPVFVSGNDVPTIVAASKASAKFILDVQTFNWSFVYFPSQWGKYRVMYTAKGRLIDAGTDRVVAEGFCKRIPEYTADAPTYDELLANSAARLKSELSIAAATCIETLKNEMLSPK